jgi:hypothetical protein
MRALLWLLPLLALLAPGTQARAEPACGRRTDLLKELADRYKEAPVAIGLASNGSLLEVLSSGGGTTWTIIITAPNGTSCLVAAGEDWRQQNVPLAQADGRPL